MNFSTRFRAGLKRLELGSKSILGSSRFPAIAALIAVALGSPALSAGFRLDDYFHRAVLLEEPRFTIGDRTPREMFRFMKGDPEEARRRMDIGAIPWWTDPESKAEFLQAITVETHILDYRLWPNSPRLMHAQSLFWLAALVFAFGLLARRLIRPTWIAGLATLLFAIDDAHGTPAGWLANRNSLIAATFGLLSVIALDAWRRDKRLWGAIVSPLGLAASLFSKEEGIATCAYLFAFAVCLDPQGPKRGIRALIPHALAVVAWRLVREAMGYGVAHLGLYIDPVDDPIAFAQALFFRGPILFLGLWTPIPSEIVIALRPNDRWVAWSLGIATMVGSSLIFARWLWSDRRARFWALGMLLSIVPVCATWPANRLLTAPSIGFAGLLAIFLANVFKKRNPDPRSRGRRVFERAAAWTLIAFHLVVAPLALAERAGNPLAPRRLEARLQVELPNDKTIERRTVILVNPPLPLYACYLTTRRQLRGEPVPDRVRILASGMPEVTATRLDEKTIAVRPEGGFLAWPFDELFRPRKRRLKLGERVVLTGMTAEVRSLTADGRPAEVAFRFDVPLEDASLCWICYKEGAFRAYRPPSTGKSESIRIGLPLKLLSGD